MNAQTDNPAGPEEVDPNVVPKLDRLFSLLTRSKTINWDLIDVELERLSSEPALHPVTAARWIHERRNRELASRVRIVAFALAELAGAWVPFMLLAVGVTLALAYVLLNWGGFATPLQLQILSIAQSRAETLRPAITSTIKADTSSPLTVSADGATARTLLFSVLDQAGAPVPDGTTIEFSVSPVDAGSLQPTQTTTLGGRASTAFTPGHRPVKASVVARAVLPEVALPVSITEFRQSVLEVHPRAAPNRELRLGESTEISFMVTNSGNAAATPFDVIVRVPTGTIMVRATGQLLDNRRTVVWHEDNLSPGGKVSEALLLQVSELGRIVIAPGDYWIQSGGSNPQITQGQEQIEFVVGSAQLTSTPTSEPTIQPARLPRPHT